MGASEKVVEMPLSPQAERPALRPAQCRAYVRNTLAAEFREIVDGFVQEAKRGSCQHVKLATELLETKAAKRAKPSGSPTLRRLVSRMQQLEK